MIEIIKSGTKHIKTCSKCGCEFSYENIDVSREFMPFINEDKVREYVFCPQCDNKVIIRESK